MARETSDFDDWAQSIEESTDGLELIPALNTASKIASEAFGLHIWFVEILGRRWSYIAGRVIEEPAQSDVHRIALNGNIGVVSDTWETLSATERDKLITLLNRLIKTKRGC